MILYTAGAVLLLLQSVLSSLLVLSPENLPEIKEKNESLIVLIHSKEQGHIFNISVILKQIKGLQTLSLFIPPGDFF